MLDRYPHPGKEGIFNQMGGGATIFSKQDLRSVYHQMPVRLVFDTKLLFF